MAQIWCGTHAHSSRSPPPSHECFVLCSQFENNYFTEMCSGSEAGSYLRLIGCVYHSTLGLRVIKKKRRVLCVIERDRIDSSASADAVCNNRCSSSSLLSLQALEGP